PRPALHLQRFIELFLSDQPLLEEHFTEAFPDSHRNESPLNNIGTYCHKHNRFQVELVPGAALPRERIELRERKPYSRHVISLQRRRHGPLVENTPSSTRLVFRRPGERVRVVTALVTLDPQSTESTGCRNHS